MKLLAIDTATEACSVALLIDDQVIDRFVPTQNGHSEMLLAMAEDILLTADIQLKDLDAIAFDRGPGSFTGVRIGTGVAQALSFSLEIPVIGVSSLAALAMGTSSEYIAAAIDARMGEVYWCCYQRRCDDILLPLTAEQLLSPQAVALPTNQAWLGVGSGWDNYSDVLTRISVNKNISQADKKIDWKPECYPRAGDIAKLAQQQLGSDPDRPESKLSKPVLPVYLRNQVAAKSANR